jgi:hypothetical protein
MILRRSRAAIFTILIGLSAGAVRGQDTVTISKSRLTELERKAAETDRLAGELEKAREEISRLKGEVAARPKAVYQPVLPPQVEQAIQKLPPTRPMTELPALQKGEIVQVSDLLNHYAADSAAADLRYRKKNFKLRGIVTDVDKPMLVSSYKIYFRIPGNPLKMVCDVRSPEYFQKVYVKDREQVMGETRNGIVKLVAIGQAVTLNGHCAGLKDGAIIFDYSEQLSEH